MPYTKPSQRLQLVCEHLEGESEVVGRGEK